MSSMRVFAMVRFRRQNLLNEAATQSARNAGGEVGYLTANEPKPLSSRNLPVRRKFRVQMAKARIAVVKKLTHDPSGSLILSKGGGKGV
jgi:hypothetical protein